MVSKETIAPFLKMSSDRIILGLNKDQWEAEKRVAAIEVLKKRGKDVSAYVKGDVEQKPVSDPAKVEELKNLIEKAVQGNDDELLGTINVLLEGVEEVDQLDNESLDHAISTIKNWRNSVRIDAEVKEKVARRRREKQAPNLMKGVPELTDEEKAKVDSIFKEKLTKKATIIKLFDEGFSRSQVIKLQFCDPVYVYDLWRIRETK